MADRRLTALTATVAALLFCAILWDAFKPAPHARHAVAGTTDSVPPDTTPRLIPPRSALHTDSSSAGTTAVATSSSGSVQPSYIDQLARSEARRRIRASAGYTYLNEIVGASQDSGLHRWDDRFDHPVRVYIPQGTAANFQPEFMTAVRNAFQRWQDAGIPVRFNIESDSERAEVHFRWKVQFDIPRTGQTDLMWDRDGRVLSGVITLATFDPKGRPLSAADIEVVTLHEIGHLIGLDHSSDSSDIMYAETQVRDLSARDIRTAMLLYQLAPGPLR
jgi:predicted Zn-dependent protease